MIIRRWAGEKGMVVLAMAIVLLAAACGGKSGTTSSGGGASPSSSSTGGGGHGYGYGGGGGTTTGTGSGGGKSAVTVQQTTALRFVPATFSVKGGSSITLENNTTSIPHNFTVKGQGIDVTQTPGQSRKVKIDLKPGTYQFFCKFHRSRGMVGTVVVTS